MSAKPQPAPIPAHLLVLNSTTLLEVRAVDGQAAFTGLRGVESKEDTKDKEKQTK